MKTSRWAVVTLVVAAATARATTNQVLVLNGSTDYVVVPDDVNLQLTDTDYTVSAWILPQTHKYMHVVTKRSGSSGWHLRVDSRTNATTSAAFVLGSGGDPGISTTNPIPLGIWTHVAVTYRAVDSNVWLYLDGQLVRSTNVLRAPIATTRELHIGRDTSAAQYYFDGMIEDVRIWRRLLTVAEIRGLMHEHLTGDETGLTAYWPFDDGTASDATGYGHDGTFMGTATTAPDLAVTNRIAEAIEVYFDSGSPLTDYQLQVSTNLLGPDWQDTGRPAPGNGGEQSLFDNPRGATSRFYRVITEY